MGRSMGWFFWRLKIGLATTPRRAPPLSKLDPMDWSADELNKTEPIGQPRAASLKTATAVVIGGLFADQLTKLWAVRTLEDREPISLLPTLEFDLHYNSGFSFGTGQGAGRWIGLVVVAMTIYLATLIRKETSPRRSIILSLILSGAIGNLLDRLLRAEDGFLSGRVVDFIDVSWFAIFNVADIFVVGGVILFAFFELVTMDRSGAGEGQ